MDEAPGDKRVLDPAKIGFREMQLDDLGLMHQWLNTDFVAEWYGKRKRSYEEVYEKYSKRVLGQQPINCHLMLYEHKPIGYIQVYRVKDFPEYNPKYLSADSNAAAIDLFIGEADFIHRGFGSHFLRKFLKEIVFGQSDAETCLIDPEPANIIAIRAYEKVGFKHLETMQRPNEEAPSYIMRIDRAAVVGQ